MTVRTSPVQRDGIRERVGYALFACQSCGGEVSTANAAAHEQMPDGLRFLGAPCNGCDPTYTVEMTDAPNDG